MILCKPRKGSSNEDLAIRRYDALKLLKRNSPFVAYEELTLEPEEDREEELYNVMFRRKPVISLGIGVYSIPVKLMARNYAAVKALSKRPMYQPNFFSFKKTKILGLKLISKSITPEDGFENDGSQNARISVEITDFRKIIDFSILDCLNFGLAKKQTEPTKTMGPMSDHCLNLMSFQLVQVYGRKSESLKLKENNDKTKISEDVKIEEKIRKNIAESFNPGPDWTSLTHQGQVNAVQLLKACHAQSKEHSIQISRDNKEHSMHGAVELHTTDQVSRGLYFSSFYERKIGGNNHCTCGGKKSFLGRLRKRAS